MKTIIHTKKAPQPIGPYSQAVRFESFVFLSGQIAIDPATGKLKCDTIEAETQQVMENIDAILKSLNADCDQILKTTIFLRDMDDFASVNAVYGTFFDHNSAPARETVQVARLPKDVNVEISCVVGLQT